MNNNSDNRNFEDAADAALALTGFASGYAVDLMNLNSEAAYLSMIYRYTQKLVQDNEQFDKLLDLIVLDALAHGKFVDDHHEDGGSEGYLAPDDNGGRGITQRLFNEGLQMGEANFETAALFLHMQDNKQIILGQSENYPYTHRHFKDLPRDILNRNLSAEFVSAKLAEATEYVEPNGGKYHWIEQPDKDDLRQQALSYLKLI